MTYNRDNIVGVEFTVPNGDDTVYTVSGYDSTGTIPVITWNDGVLKYSYSYTVNKVIHYLNNGTWIVKNSKV